MNSSLNFLYIQPFHGTQILYNIRNNRLFKFLRSQINHCDDQNLDSETKTPRTEKERS